MELPQPGGHLGGGQLCGPERRRLWLGRVRGILLGRIMNKIFASYLLGTTLIHLPIANSTVSLEVGIETWTK